MKTKTKAQRNLTTKLKNRKNEGQKTDDEK